MPRLPWGFGVLPVKRKRRARRSHTSLHRQHPPKRPVLIGLEENLTHRAVLARGFCINIAAISASPSCRKQLYIRLDSSEKSNMPKKCWLLQNAGLSLCVFASILSGRAVAAGPANSPFIVNTWHGGLPGSVVFSVIQTRDGYLWLGTQHGLVRFDGIRPTVFDEETTPGLNNDQIDCLFEDSRTNLWIGTDAGGAALEKDGRIENFSIGYNNHDGRLVSACEDLKRGRLALYGRRSSGPLSERENGCRGF